MPQCESSRLRLDSFSPAAGPWLCPGTADFTDFGPEQQCAGGERLTRVTSGPLLDYLRDSAQWCADQLLNSQEVPEVRLYVGYRWAPLTVHQPDWTEVYITSGDAYPIQARYQLGHEAFHVARGSYSGFSWSDEMLAETASVLALRRTSLAACHEYARERIDSARAHRGEPTTRSLARLSDYPADAVTFYARVRKTGLDLHDATGLDGLRRVARAGSQVSLTTLVRQFPRDQQAAVSQALGLRTRH